MIEKESQKLLEKYRLGTLTTEERAVLESWYNNYYKNSGQPMFSEADMQNDLDDIYQLLPINQSIKEKLPAWPVIRIAKYAASIILFAAIGIFFLKNKGEEHPKLSAVPKTEIKPANGRAVLILANNKKIVLDDNAVGDVAREGNIVVKKTSGGLLTYQIKDPGLLPGATADSNTITIPQGKKYQVILSDGTKVWLNAMSSIRFPTAFKGVFRQVTITGEAYFEVAKDPKKPFRVMSASQTVEVLGTHFNINNYANESTAKTTLLEGSVKVSLPDGRFNLLKPGQQSVIVPNNGAFNVVACEAEDAVAWRDGFFQFKDSHIKTIMNEIARWYDVEIVYQNIDQELVFGGSISRSKNLSDVLRILTLTGNVKFNVEGRRVTVMP